MRRGRLFFLCLALALLSGCAPGGPVAEAGADALLPADKLIAITFDDGPRRDTTERLLDGLQERGASATFFLIGKQIEGNEDLIRRMQAEGHQVAFHSARHRSAYLMTPRQTRRDFRDGLAALDRLGVCDPLFRPPWGVVNLSSLRQIKARRLRPVLWDVMAQDWRGDITAGEIARRLDRRTFPGAVICLHDGRGAPGAPARTVQALEEQLPKWLAQGFRFQTMEHCL